MRHLFAALTTAAICGLAGLALADSPGPDFCAIDAGVGAACGAFCHQGDVAIDAGVGTCQDAGLGALLCTPASTCPSSGGGGCSSGGSLFGPALIALVVPALFWRRRRRAA